MAMAATMSLDSTRFAREGRGRCTRARGLVPGARPRVVLRNVASDTRGKGRGRYPRTNKAVTCMAVTRVMISGAPASGKGTQCELLSENFGLTHISAGDLLRAEVASGTANGKKAKEFMDAGKLVPNEIVVTMVKDRLSQSDAQAGWLLDGYPRSKDQADALEEADIRPEVFLLLEVPEEMLVERVVGRRLDPETGKIYHLKYAPPESDEIAARLIQRSDDTEEKVVPRLETHNSNVAAILDSYKDALVRINGNQAKDQVYADIESALKSLNVSA